MAQTAKRRRIGQTRTSGVASLHPRAHDTRADGETVSPSVEDVNALPLSSSDEDDIVHERNEDDSKSRSSSKKHVTSKPLEEIGQNDTPFRQTFSQGRSKITYGKKSFSKGESVTSQSSKHPSSKREAANPSISSKDGISTSKEVKRPADMPKSKRKPAFRVPATVATVTKKATFRTPSLVERTPPKAPSFRMPSGSAKDFEQVLAASSSQHEDEASCVGSTPATQLASSQSQPITSSNTVASIAATLADAERDVSPDTFATCPICRAPLSEETLDAFQVTLRGLSVKSRYHRQAAFCRAHREAEAQQTWSERGYPTIDWTLLPSRLEPHKATMLDVLEQRRVSHFRDQLQTKVDARRVAGLHTGRDTLAQEFEREDDGAESVGYYGGRGAQIMMNWLATSLAEPLRTARDTDALFKACGSVSAFVQRVLLPELATLLVVDDMRIAKGKAPKARRLKPPVTTAEAEAARQRLEESAELGRLLCLEEDDEILAEDEEGEERKAEFVSEEEVSEMDTE